MSTIITNAETLSAMLELHNQLSHEPDDDPIKNIATKYIVFHCVSELGSNGDTFTEEQVEKMFTELVTSHTLERLVYKDLVEVDLSEDEPRYKIKQ